MKEFDVYRFNYHPEEYKKRFEPYHCFDGKLIAIKNRYGELVLKDTYWLLFLDGLNSESGKQFFPETVSDYGTITFICNLNDVESLDKPVEYYREEDIFDLIHHHGYHKWFVKKKGAKIDKEKMLGVIREEIEKEKRNIRFSQNSIRNLREKQQKILSGEDPYSIYI